MYGFYLSSENSNQPKTRRLCPQRYEKPTWLPRHLREVFWREGAKLVSLEPCPEPIWPLGAGAQEQGRGQACADDSWHACAVRGPHGPQAGARQPRARPLTNTETKQLSPLRGDLGQHHVPLPGPMSRRCAAVT